MTNEKFVSDTIAVLRAAIRRGKEADSLRTVLMTTKEGNALLHTLAKVTDPKQEFGVTPITDEDTLALINALHRRIEDLEARNAVLSKPGIAATPADGEETAPVAAEPTEPTEPPESHVVAVGSPFEGIELYGPFGSYDDALYWAENDNDVRNRHDWHVLSITAAK